MTRRSRIGAAMRELVRRSRIGAAMRELLRRRDDVRTAVLPSLTTMTHIAVIAHLGHAGLGRHLRIAVLLATGTPRPTRVLG